MVINFLVIQYAISDKNTEPTIFFLRASLFSKISCLDHVSVKRTVEKHGYLYFKQVHKLDLKCDRDQMVSIGSTSSS